MNARLFRLLLGVVMVAYLATFVYNNFIDPNPGISNRDKAFFDENGNPIKSLGKVAWIRDFSAAKSLSGMHGRDMFFFFLDIPGSDSAENFGESFFSNPFVCEILETNFIPIAVFRNKSDSDDQLEEILFEAHREGGTLLFTNNEMQRISKHHRLTYQPGKTIDFILEHIAKQSEMDYLNYLVWDEGPDAELLIAKGDTELSLIPLTALQIERINELSSQNKDYNRVLSPRQKEVLGLIKRNPELDWTSAKRKGFSAHWWSVLEFANQNKLL